MAKRVLTPQAENFPRWYQDVVARAELAESGPVRGTMVIRPYAYAIWERLQAELDSRIKQAGAVNAYFPLLIPESYLRREAEHVEGFSPELAVVTHGGGKELEEPAVIRPTSETIINTYFARWIQSHRDLPLLINQWANVVRWELRPRLFLRTTEFLWQEGHTAHTSAAEARDYALGILHEVYETVARDVLAIPVVVGRKTDRERFAGAEATYTIEGMMGDGKALQMGTSHELGQNFSRAFGIEFQDSEGGTAHAWQTSWGVSTRLLGALIMAHGDDAGLRLPPSIAPVQAVVVAVRDEGEVVERARALGAELAAAGIRTQVDDRCETGFGRRVIDWEIKGVPVRAEIGPRDLAQGTLTLVRRDRGEKTTVALADATRAATELLGEAQASLVAEATRRRDDRTVEATSADEVLAGEHTGFIRLPWDAVRDDEERLADAGLTVRCLQRDDGSGMPASSREAGLVATVAKAY